MSEIEGVGVPVSLMRELSSLASKASDPERMFMEQMSQRQREPNRDETAVEELEKLGADRAKAVAFFKNLEGLGCGKFIEGRHKRKSRMSWNRYGAIAVAKAYLTAPDQIPSEATTAEAPNDTALSQSAVTLAKMHQHVFLLRPDLSIAFDLPLDLTKEEANRLAEFVRAIPF